jgi:predicted protein tyrosine phosphatase
MPIQSLQFLSLDEAEAFVPQQSTVAISILSPGRAAANLHSNIVEVLRLAFHDGVPRENNPPGTTVFSSEDARSVIDFLRRQQADPTARHLLIHCEAGISRSAAVAVFAASECRVPLAGQFAFLNPWVLSTLVKTAYPHYAFD